MATGAGQSDFNTNNIAVDKTAPDGLDRQITLFGTAGQNAALDIGAILGPTNETAPTSDTGTAGQNGRLQRIAQRLTSILSVLPASLGQLAKAASFPVVLPSDQIVPINASTLTAVTAAWTSATGNNSALSLAVTGYNSVAVALNPTSTFTAGTLTFEASYDGGTTWYPIAGVRLDSFTAESSYAIVASTIRIWQFNVAGLTNFRVRLSPVIAGTGTANLSVQASAAAVSPLTVVGGTVAANVAPASAGTPIGPSTVTSSGVATLLTADATRKAFQLNNESDFPVYLGFVNTITNTGTNRFWLLNARTPYTNSVYTGALYAIGPSANGGNNAIISGAAFN